MRVTENITLSLALMGQTRTAQRLADLTRAASSGQRVGAPSDDPVAYETAARLDTRISVLQDRGRVATRAAGDMDAAESSLAAAGDLFVRAREIAVQMANGTVDAATRASEVTEVQGLRDSLLGIANSRGATGYLFGGTRTATQPFDATGGFTGNDDVLRVEVADGVTANANTSGAKAFTAVGGHDLLGALQTFATALSRNDVPGIQAAVDTMEAGQKQLVAARIDAGLGSERLRSAADVTGNAVTTATSARSTAVDINAPETYSALSATQFAYTRSVDVTRQILSLASLARS